MGVIEAFLHEDFPMTHIFSPDQKLEEALELLIDRMVEQKLILGLTPEQKNNIKEKMYNALLDQFDGSVPQDVLQDKQNLKLMMSFIISLSMKEKNPNLDINLTLALKKFAELKELDPKSPEYKKKAAELQLLVDEMQQEMKKEMKESKQELSEEEQAYQKLLDETFANLTGVTRAGQRVSIQLQRGDAMGSRHDNVEQESTSILNIGRRTDMVADPTALDIAEENMASIEGLCDAFLEDLVSKHIIVQPPKPHMPGTTTNE